MVMFRWFTESQMKPNADKCWLILNCFDKKEIKIDRDTIKSSNCEKLLGVKVDKKINFNPHVAGLCKKANQKVHALSRVNPYMLVAKKRSLVNAFFISQYLSLIIVH